MFIFLIYLIKKQILRKTILICVSLKKQFSAIFVKSVCIKNLKINYEKNTLLTIISGDFFKLFILANKGAIA